MPLLYAGTLFSSAFLLFLLQPMIAKMLLPQFGGSPSVWNTCMVFFQAELLAGYVYAHLLGTWLTPRRQVVVHLLLLAASATVLLRAVWPIGMPEHADQLPPILSLFALLTTTVAVPFFALTATAPLLQKWFACSGHATAGDPYYLYAASNGGSLLALLAYPLVIEPRWRLAAQAQWWTLGFLATAFLLAACALPVARHSKVPVPSTKQSPTARGVSWPTRLRWILLAFIPSSCMIGVTTYLTTDLAPIPLLWIMPLAVYLLTFIVAFARWPETAHRLILRVLPLVLLLQFLLMLVEHPRPIWLVVLLHLVGLYVIAQYCHGELSRDRPEVTHLTEFYLWLSLGGVLGGIFNALLAPVVFPMIVEYPLVGVLACAISPRGLAMEPKPIRWLPAGAAAWLPIALGITAALCMIALHTAAEYIGWSSGIIYLGMPALLMLWSAQRWGRRFWQFGLGIGIVMLTTLLDATTQGRHGSVLHLERNFYGTLRVVQDRFLRRLYHGSTVHGAQFVDAEGQLLRPALPLSYYHELGPIGQVLKAMRGSAITENIAIVGLGSGALARHGRPGQRITYYEIDPAVERIARSHFTYLEDSQAEVAVVLGDARLRLREAPAHAYGMIIVDAFGSDAIPVHLVTREAVALYLDKLKDDGILAFHISNQYLDLTPIMAQLAKANNLIALEQFDMDDSPQAMALGKDVSHWVLMARSSKDFGPLASDKRWSELKAKPSDPLWTDDYSNLLRVIFSE